MELIDYHTHTFYSFDSDETPENLCNAAIEKGISSVAITDHYEVDYEDSGLPMIFEAKKRKEHIYGLKEKFKGKLDVVYGIELGQPHNYPEKAREIISDGGYEFVLGSLHNLKGVPDFYFLDYSRMPDEMIENLISRMLDETALLADFKGIDAIAHLTYPMRYLASSDKVVDLKKFYNKFDNIFSIMIKNGISLEINTSTLWKGLRMTMPSYEILKLYRECGGTLITVGSDAHKADDLGKGIKEAYDALKSLGFEYVTAFKNGEKVQIKI